MANAAAKSIGLNQLDHVAKSLAERVAGAASFTLLLMGEVGTGKTTLTKSFFTQLGLKDPSQVQSPTFTYINEYRVGSDLYAHCDFYRFGANFKQLDEVITSVDWPTYRGVVIEWPESAPFAPKSELTVRLKLAYEDTLATRSYSFF